MNILVSNITVSDMAVMEGDEIAVFDNGLCVGTGVVTEMNGKMSANIVAAMDDPTTDEIDGYTEGNSMTFKYLNAGLTNPIELTAESVSGELTFKALGTCVATLENMMMYVVEKNAGNINISAYPNPATSTLTLDYIIPRGQVYLGIIDLNGVRVMEVMNDFREAGDHSQSIDVSSLSKGFYVLQVRVFSNDKIFILTRNWRLRRQTQNFTF